MRRSAFLAGGALALASALWGCSGMPGPGGGWTTLIDGERGLENFNRLGEANWHGADGAIVADNRKEGYLVSRQSYRDFQIRAEFWADHDTNSGVFLRAQNPSKIDAVSAYECNIFDERPDPTYGTGAIVNLAKVVPMPKAGGHWNTYEITAQGTHLVVVLNGVKTVDVQDGKHAQGPFALQYAAPGGAIKWRKVQIREL